MLLFILLHIPGTYRHEYKKGNYQNRNKRRNNKRVTIKKVKKYKERSKRISTEGLLSTREAREVAQKCVGHWKRRGNRKRSKGRLVREQKSEQGRPGKLRTDFPWVLITSSLESMLKPG